MVGGSDDDKNTNLFIGFVDAVSTMVEAPVVWFRSKH